MGEHCSLSLKHPCNPSLTLLDSGRNMSNARTYKEAGPSGGVDVCADAMLGGPLLIEAVASNTTVCTVTCPQCCTRPNAQHGISVGSAGAPSSPGGRARVCPCCRTHNLQRQPREGRAARLAAGHSRGLLPCHSSRLLHGPPGVARGMRPSCCPCAHVKHVKASPTAVLAVRANNEVMTLWQGRLLPALVTQQWRPAATWTAKAR